MQYNQFTNEEIPFNEITFSGGCVRLDKELGVYLHTNSAHKSVGIESVSINEKGHLQVSRFKSDPIISVIVTPDETLAAKGITLGASGGARDTSIILYDRAGRKLDLNLKEDYDQVASLLSNVWVAFYSN